MQFYFCIILIATALVLKIDQSTAAENTPVNAGGLEYVCTGVGSTKEDPRWGSYPIKLVFSNSAREFAAGVHVSISKGGQLVMEADCESPWLLIKAPEGEYTIVSAVIDGATRVGAKFTGGNRRQKVLNITLPGS